ncbi:hypothetical protein vseg_013714 [Gypsophila vaccaria]
MGCGGSKLDPTQDDIPARFKPVLQRRLEEIRAKRSIKDSNNNNNNNNNGISKKQLVGNTSKDDVASTSDDDHQSFCFTQDCPPSLQKICDDNSLKLSLETARNNAHNDDDCGSSSSSNNKTDQGRFLRKRHVSEGSIVGVYEEIDNADDYERGVLGRGSPSFKVYCTEILEEDERDEHIGEEDVDEDQRSSIGRESTCSNEVSVKQIPTKKEKRGMKFKIAMPKGGKIYKNMQVFYNFPCSSQTNSHLLEKAAA